MLGRRQIREKVVETLYSYHQNPEPYVALEKKFFYKIGKIYNLYVYQLNFLVALRDLAEQQIEIGKQKFIKKEEDINPNQKFINNQVLRKLEENTERLSFTSKNKELKWDLHDELLVKTFQKIKAGKRYQDFMKEENISFDDDQKFIGKLFLRYVAENEDFQDYVSDRELSWTDDIHISNSMIQKTIGFMKEDEYSHTLIRMLKDGSDEDFAKKLLWESVKNWEENEKKIEERLQNWDLDRVSLMDKIILIAAIAELDHFPFTASRIIINEYVEISKVFSTDKSNIFINGILDKYSKDQNRI
ncbi:MAG: transcription antitermination factor NusB [Cruoricaptor ignavus]|nr:transcription antitermination factor NusB [Cruoricaptor ignavus]